ncbi:MAG: hypothetical protein JXA54_07290 [Candidatus Heimdallarchaeota archaeon]|nr:hypothetical protein [Candidatus Heimdallarchaeota archaeon]
MDAQIIISREDNTDFASIGFIQTDTSLISALGGALANFAQEIGLAGEVETSGKKKNSINFSRFQNGILASKIVQVKNHTPIILIAIKGFEGEDKDLDFVVDFASVLAQEIVIKFESDYTSIGLIPQIDDAYETVASVANQMYKRSSEKVRYFTKTIRDKIATILESIWQNQDSFERWVNENTAKKLTHLNQTDLLNELAKYFYVEGIKTDAFFPLAFASSVNPLDELIKILDGFLTKKASLARKEIETEIARIFTQLKDSSRALSKREISDIPEVELINESFIFEKILVAKNDQLEKIVIPLFSEINQDLYRKLFLKYPLKFAAMSKESVYDKNELDSQVQKTVNSILKAELTDKTWINEKILTILRDVSSKFSPDLIMKNQKQILEKTHLEFFNALKSEHPFILFADPALENLNKFVVVESKKALDRFTTTLDEAVILYNSIGQIHSGISKESNPNTQDLMILYFLQQVIQPYQFRDVPEIVYSLIIECLGKISPNRKKTITEIIESSIHDFEKKLDFTIVPVTKKIVLNRIAKIKPTVQYFETFEDLNYFFKSFRSSLESTVTKILQKIFGPEKFPFPPSILIKTIDQIAADLQSVYVMKLMLTRIIRRPNGRDLFETNLVKVIESNTKFKYVLPTPFELAKSAYENGWLKSTDQKKEDKISLAQLKILQVKIPSLKLEGELQKLLEQPTVNEALWSNFAANIIESRLKDLKLAITDLEKQMKVTAGSATGKQKFGSILKELKSANRCLTNVISGGGALRKFFSGGKEFQTLIQDSSKDIYPIFRYHPEKYRSYVNDQIVKNISILTAVIGDFQDLLQIYSSLWLVDSQYTSRIMDTIFWNGLLKTTEQLTSSDEIDKKILLNLRSSYKKDAVIDQNSIIRSSIVEDTVPSFNKIVRTALSEPFNIFKDERLVKYDEKSNDWYVSLGVVNIPQTAIKSIFNGIKNVQLKKIQNDQTEICLILTEYYSLKRNKETQTLEEFIRKSVFNELNKAELKALEFFSNLNEKYIGKSTADTFYSFIRSLAQIIITPVS